MSVLRRTAVVAGAVPLLVLAVAPSAEAASSRTWVADVSGYTTPHAGVVTGSPITGRSQITTTADGSSVVTIRADHLTPGHEYGVHVHFGRCADFLGHFRYDPAGPGTRANEVWLDLVAGPSGVASNQVRVAALPGDQSLSVVIHAESNPDSHDADPNVVHPGPRLACGDYSPAGG